MPRGDPRYIAIEGPIGVGKSSLAEKLASTLNARLIKEKAFDNPFLGLFYKDRKQHAFQTQVFFLLARYQQQLELKQQDLFQQVTVCDYLFSKDRIFASMNLSPDELTLYQGISRLLDSRLHKPDLVIYLQASTETLLKRIKKRGSPFEKYMEPGYLVELAEAYNQFFFGYTECELLVVNTSDIDFVKNEQDYDNLLAAIRSPKRGQRHYLTIGQGS